MINLYIMAIINSNYYACESSKDNVRVAVGMAKIYVKNPSVYINVLTTPTITTKKKQANTTLISWFG